MGVPQYLKEVGEVVARTVLLGKGGGENFKVLRGNLLLNSPRWHQEWLSLVEVSQLCRKGDLVGGESLAEKKVGYRQPGEKGIKKKPKRKSKLFTE